MVYKQVVLGPFCGLFAIHFDEYTQWTQQEVVERLDKIEPMLGLIKGKRFFIFNGYAPGERVTPNEAEILSLCDILHARGYTIQTISDGNYYPLHAGKSDSVVALIAGDKWINYPCNAVVWYPETLKDPPNLFRPHTHGIPKYIYIRTGTAEGLLRFLNESEYQWVVQGAALIGRGYEVTI